MHVILKVFTVSLLGFMFSHQFMCLSEQRIQVATSEVKKAERPIIKKVATEVKGECRTIVGSLKTLADMARGEGL